MRYYNQGRNHVFKVGRPIPWSKILLPFYRKIRPIYPVWCSRLHNHTLFIRKLRKKLRGLSKFLGSGPHDPRVVAPTTITDVSAKVCGLSLFSLYVQSNNVNIVST